MRRIKIHYSDTDMMSIHPIVGGGIRVICKCEWLCNFFPKEIDAIRIPVVLTEVMERISTHVKERH